MNILCQIFTLLNYLKISQKRLKVEKVFYRNGLHGRNGRRRVGIGREQLSGSCWDAKLCLVLHVACKATCGNCLRFYSFAK